MISKEAWYHNTLVLHYRSDLMVASNRDHYATRGGRRAWTVSSYVIRRDVMDWLAENLADRYMHRCNETNENVIYFTDREAATLFKMFWL